MRPSTLVVLLISLGSGLMAMLFMAKISPSPNLPNLPLRLERNVGSIKNASTIILNFPDEYRSEVPCTEITTEYFHCIIRGTPMINIDQKDVEVHNDSDNNYYLTFDKVKFYKIIEK